MVTTRKKYPMNCQACGDKAMLQKNRIRHCCQERWKWKPGLLLSRSSEEWDEERHL